MAYTYSKCNAEGVRFLAYYYTTACRLGFPLPPNVPNLPCNINCGAGHYLQPGAQTCRCCACVSHAPSPPPHLLTASSPCCCSSCKAGTFSLGGGKRWDFWPSDRLPLPFTTYCRARSDEAPATPDNCKGWQGSGTLLNSGVTGDGMESVLELHVEMVTQGRVVYIHRVDAEVPYDGL